MKNVHYMTRLELESELIERRLQVQNLIQEIKRKDEYIRIYSDGLNKIMEKESENKNGKNWNAKKNTRILKKSN